MVFCISEFPVSSLGWCQNVVRLQEEGETSIDHFLHDLADAAKEADGSETAWIFLVLAFLVYGYDLGLLSYCGDNAGSPAEVEDLKQCFSRGGSKMLQYVAGDAVRPGSFFRLQFANGMLQLLHGEWVAHAAVVGALWV